MRFLLEPVSGPEIEPVTLAEMIEHLREFSTLPTAAQTQIEGLITTGREWVENYTGRACVDQTWRLTVDQSGILLGDRVRGYTWQGRDLDSAFCGNFFWASRVGELMLRKSPILAITSFASVDSDGVETEIDAATYQVREANSKWPRVVALSGASWALGTFRITFRAGFADRTGSPQQDASVIPQRFKQAIKLYAESLYDRDPDMMQKLQDTATNIIKPERANLQIA